MNVGQTPNSVDMRGYKVRILCVEKKDIGHHVPEPGQMSHSSRRYYKHKDIQGSLEDNLDLCERKSIGLSFINIIHSA